MSTRPATASASTPEPATARPEPAAQPHGAIVATGIEHTYTPAGTPAGTSAGQPVVALARTDLVVQPGEFVSLVGPSGSGKTTLLNILAGLLTPTHGQVTITGENPAGAGVPVVGYMTQHDTLLPWRTALKNVAFPLELSRTAKQDRLTRAASLLDRVGLTGFAGHFPHQLSGGMRQRVSLARALIYGPPVLLLDEPFGALDGTTRLALHRVLAEVCNDLGTTVLLVTHDLAEAVSLSDRVLALAPRPGRVVREFTIPRQTGQHEVRDIYSEPELIALHNELREV
jgi:NitT/TauT family transport system ATP-binding protein